MFSRLNSIILVTVLLGAVSSTAYFFHFDLGRLAKFVFPHRTDITSTHLFFFQFLLLNALYFFVVYIVFKRPHQPGRSRGLLLVLFLFAVFFRLCLVGSTPQLSSDMYRYVWDGRVQSQGINPYVHPPSSDSLASLRDKAIYPHINRKSFPTIYPAGAQIFFLATHKLVGDSIRGLKAVFVLFDVLTMIVLIALLRTYGLQETRFVVYAWNPLVILEISHSGHLEGFSVFLVVLAFFLYSIDKKTLGVLSLACASATKIYPALLLPAFINRGERIKSLSIFFSCLLVFYLPYVSAGKKMLGFLPIYFRDPYESFNLGLKYFLMHMFPRLDYFAPDQDPRGNCSCSRTHRISQAQGKRGNTQVLIYSDQPAAHFHAGCPSSVVRCLVDSAFGILPVTSLAALFLYGGILLSEIRGT